MFTSRLLAGAALLLSAGLAFSSCSSKPATTSTPVETHSITDAAKAQLTVPTKPARVVTLHYAGTQAVYDLGGTLVGQGDFEPGILPKAWEADLTKVPVVTAKGEPKIEEIATLKPDLILAPNTVKDDVLQQLNKIAPTFRFTLRGANRAQWNLRVTEVATALNRQDKLADLETRFKKRQEEIAAAHADTIKGKKVAVIDSYAENTFYAWGEKNVTGTRVMRRGFTWSAQENAAVAKAERPEETLSNELIGATVGDADILFYGTNLRNETNSFYKALESSALYKEIPAVKGSRAFPFGKNTVAGYADAFYSLDQVEAALKTLGGK